MKMISVIIPTYKPQSYLFDCLLSIKNQDAKSSSYEVLVILNGDKEGYYDQIVHYITDLKAFNIYLHYSVDSGVSAARNYGLDLAKGDYIIFIDDDDLISTNYLSSLRSVVKNRSICVSNEKVFKNTLSDLENGYVSKAFLKAKDVNSISKFKMRSFLSSACFKIIPKEVINTKRFNPKFKTGEDALFMASISSRIDHIYLSTEDTIYYRRIREGSASRKPKSFFLKLRNSFLLFLAYLKLYLSNPFGYNFTFFLTRFVAVFKSVL